MAKCPSCGKTWDCGNNDDGILRCNDCREAGREQERINTGILRRREKYQIDLFKGLKIY